MTAAHQFRRLGNSLYQFGFPIYRPLYRVYKSYADRAERALLRDTLKSGSVVVDAGANVGVYSQFLSTCVGKAGVVHSFEPEPQNCARLRVALSHLPNVQINEMAVSDQTGNSVLYISDELNVDHRAYPSEGKRRETISIQTTRLDDYMKSGEHVDLVKLDIQGYELHALRGAERVLQDNSGIKLLFELWPYGLRQAGTNWSDLIAHLQDRSFGLFETSSAGLRPFRPAAVQVHPDWYLNIFAFR